MMHDSPEHASTRPQPPLYRWECRCREPAVLLATFDVSGRIEITQRDRYWRINDRIATCCPHCGKQHQLELALAPDVLASLPRPWREERR